ncbi:tetratricopeptide repeat protein [Devosia sp.]|uniref:tetratricopeptide repeat protein n=1 Tax=Devosia sp. TaxID=1871048 RepID=UPI003BAD182E
MSVARSIAGLVLTALLIAPAMAQDNSFIDLRPKDVQFPDNMEYEDLPIGPVPNELEAPTDPQGVSNEVFGPRVDEAFGAFQRGYYLTALNLALPRAKNGDHAAQTLIGEIYSKGLGVPEDPKAAADWYAMASKSGDPLATFELALLYQDGRGVEKDRKRAADLFKTAADAGNMMAKYNLGLLYIEGIYVPPNLLEAAKLIKEAADAGIAEAQYDYAGMLTEGAGVAPDLVAAAEQFRLAATAGIVAAEVDYATVLYLGKGTAQDRPGAVKWYHKAAEAGNPVAQNRYAKLLAAGEGVDASLEDAAMWRSLARRQGLNDPMLDKLLVSIRPEELTRAEERARFWPSSPPTQVAENQPAATPAASASDAPKVSP